MDARCRPSQAAPTASSACRIAFCFPPHQQVVPCGRRQLPRSRRAERAPRCTSLKPEGLHEDAPVIPYWRRGTGLASKRSLAPLWSARAYVFGRFASRDGRISRRRLTALGRKVVVEEGCSNPHPAATGGLGVAVSWPSDPCALLSGTCRLR